MQKPRPRDARKAATGRSVRWRSRDAARDPSRATAAARGQKSAWQRVEDGCPQPARRVGCGNAHWPASRPRMWPRDLARRALRSALSRGASACARVPYMCHGAPVTPWVANVRPCLRLYISNTSSVRASVFGCAGKVRFQRPSYMARVYAPMQNMQHAHTVLLPQPATCAPLLRMHAS